MATRLPRCARNDRLGGGGAAKAPTRLTNCSISLRRLYISRS